MGHNESSLVASSTPTTLDGLSFLPLPPFFFGFDVLYPPPFLAVAAVDDDVVDDDDDDPVESVVLRKVVVSFGASAVFVVEPFVLVGTLMVVVAAVPFFAVGLEEPFFLLFFKRLWLFCHNSLSSSCFSRSASSSPFNSVAGNTPDVNDNIVRRPRNSEERLKLEWTIVMLFVALLSFFVVVAWTLLCKRVR